MTERRRIQRGWYLYDCGVSGFSTIVTVVFYGPYLTDLAERSAGADAELDVLGVGVAAESLFPYAIALSVLLQVILVPILGWFVDRTGRDRSALSALVATGAVATVGMATIAAQRWALGATLFVVATMCQGASTAVYNAYLPRIADPDERHRVSSRGWATGFLGAGVLLAADIGLLLSAGSIGIADTTAARLAILSGGLWWAAWTVLSMRTMRAVPRTPGRSSSDVSTALGARRMASPAPTRAVAAIAGTVRQLPHTWLLLVAYVLYNDGVQTVMALAVVYGAEELLLPTESLAGAVLVVQFVAAAGGLALGIAAGRWGGRRTLLACVLAWVGLVGVAYELPVGQTAPFYALAALMGFVLGGTQALSRSLFSHTVPAGREAAFFSIYQVSDRGTSWLGPLAFGLTLQATGSYRSAIIILVVFFVAGFAVLLRVDLARAIRDAANPVPARL